MQTTIVTNHNLNTHVNLIQVNLREILLQFGKEEKENLECVYEIVKKDPSLLHEKDMHGNCLLQMMLIRAGQGFCGTVGHKGYAALAIRLIELDPTVDVNYCPKKDHPSDFCIRNLENVLCCFSESEERTKLLKYLVFLGAELNDEWASDFKWELANLKDALRKDIRFNGIKGALPGLLKSGNVAFLDQKVQEFLR